MVDCWLLDSATLGQLILAQGYQILSSVLVEAVVLWMPGALLPWNSKNVWV